MTGLDEDTDPLGSTTVLPADVHVPYTAEQRLQVGTVLRDRFMLLEEVAGGSMGVVYKALDRRLSEVNSEGHWVAIKVLTPRLSGSPDALRALQQEAVKMRCLSHPNIVRFMDLDRDEDLYFLVMEWLGGSSLHDMLNEASGEHIDFEKALEIIRQIGAALEYAHQRGIVHADVKPGNIMVMPSGQVKLFDFGIARIRQKQRTGNDNFDPSVLNATTPAYSSMQVLTGENPVPADDVFSLACLTYRLIAGYRVFGPRDAAEAAEEGMEPQPIESLSKAQWQVLRKALAYSRVTRYASPAEFVAAFCESAKLLTAERESTDERESFSSARVEKDDMIGHLLEPPVRRRRWFVTTGMITLMAAIFWFQEPLRDLIETHTSINRHSVSRARPGPESLNPKIDQDLSEIVVRQSSRRPVANDSLAPGRDKPTGLVSADGDLAAQNASNTDDSGQGEFPEIRTTETHPPGTGNLKPADLSVPLPASGSASAESVLTLTEDGAPGTVDFIRTSSLAESLTLRLVEVSDNSNISSRANPQFVISDNGLIVFSAGQSRVRVSITMTSDPLREEDRETQLMLRDTGNAGVTLATITLRLRDDDRRRFEAGLAPNTVGFAVSQVSVRERDPAVQIDVIRFKPDASQMEVHYTVRDVTATDGEDYIAPASGTVLFGPGERLARILIPVVQDVDAEGDEAFMLELQGDAVSTESRIYRRIAVMIRDDDS